MSCTHPVLPFCAPLIFWGALLRCSCPLVSPRANLLRSGHVRMRWGLHACQPGRAGAPTWRTISRYATAYTRNSASKSLLSVAEVGSCSAPPGSCAAPAGRWVLAASCGAGTALLQPLAWTARTQDKRRTGPDCICRCRKRLSSIPVRSSTCCKGTLYDRCGVQPRAFPHL